MLITAITAATRPLLLIHVMPWFVANEKELGWHWRMNRTTAEVRQSGKIASHFQPLIGPYDSGDPDVLRLHLTWITQAGFDGVVADWYGINDHFDYPQIHRRTQALLAATERVGLKFCVMYEDQSIGNVIRASLLPAESKPAEARKVAAWLAQDWLKRPAWLRLRTRPTLFVFGPQSFEESEWRAFLGDPADVDLLTLHYPRPFGRGVFDWPIPNTGTRTQEEFGKNAPTGELAVPVAYPRFQDAYADGGEKGYPVIPDDDGKTLRKTLDWAAALKPAAIQVATWNDWQEGTQIEPSVQFRFRDLGTVQSFRRRLDPTFSYEPKDFERAFLEYQRNKAKSES